MEAILVHPKDKEQLLAFKNFFKTMNVPFEIQKEEKPYNSEFLEKIIRSREDSKQGRVTVIETTDLWK